MTIRTARDKIEAAEISKTINKRKTNDVRKYNMEKIEESLKQGTSMKKTKRALDIGSQELFALKDERDEIINNI